MRALLLLCGWLLSAPVMAGAPIVAAASSLQFALEEAAAQFTQQTGQALRLNFGSSGNFPVIPFGNASAPPLAKAPLTLSANYLAL